MILSNIRTRRKITAEILIRPAGESGYINLGDNVNVSTPHEVTRSKYTVNKPGHRKVIFEPTDEVKPSYKATLSQNTLESLVLLHLAEKAADVTQAAATAPAGTATLTDVQKGRTYPIGKYQLDTVVAQVSAATKTLGTDYTVDLITGAFYVIPSGTIANDDDVDLTFGCAAITFNRITAMRKATPTTGDVIINFLDQHGNQPVEIHSFTGQYYVDDRGQHDGSAVHQWGLMMLPTTEPSIQILDQ